MSNSPPIDSPPKHAPRTSNPSRLQHSPSLPNIRSPHCSGIVTREMDKQDNDILHRPSAPPSPKGKPPATVTDKVLQIRHVKYASIDPPTYRKPSVSKTHARRRTERDEPHSLLTPPLTPSSSIRTTASSDGAASTAASPATDLTDSTCEEILDPDVDSTRILLLENISLTVAVPFLESSVIEALAEAVTQSATAGDQNTPSLASTPHEIIKGINLDPLRQRNEGIIPLVFFDVRSAKIARDVILDKKFNDRLRQCIGGGGQGGFSSTDISARLITLDELCKILGNSRFLDGIDGSFSFSVEKIQREDNEGSQPIASIEEASEDPVNGSTSGAPLKNTPFTRGGVDPIVFQNILKRFGDIRSFKFIQQEVDQQGKSKVVYQVEFYDMRDAETASLELQQQVTFGMKICILDGRVATEVEPFPNPATAGPSFNGLNISPAGAQSQMRQRFAFTVSDESSPQGQLVADQPTARHSTASTGGASSPTFFYTTMPSETPNQNYQVICHDQGFPSVRGNGQEANHASQLQMIPRPPMQEYDWELEPVYRHDCISPSYSPDGLCHYCPSRSTPHGITYTPPFPPYTFSPSPPTPPIYYPGHIATPQIGPAMINLAPSPAPTMFGYEYVDPRMQPASYQGSWNYDPTIAAMGPGLNAPSPAPFFFSEDGNPTRGADRHPAPYTRSPNLAPQANQVHPQLRLEANVLAISQNTYRAHHLTDQSSTPPPSDHSGVLVAAGANDTSPPAAGAAANDRNQLNLARIISGGDTRTTIMIKNIPNKMSDRDLTAYIANVCPRKIDFLYLRMDFKNGCNVGYAFVNFIDVESLIHFARERLGAKWNMFSSEKVLQMSYANYQGKEALVEKFKNSHIMDERESWRPRIFYSSGENVGLPEAFPSPTHIRRKERSSYNRDTLFPPGVNSHTIAAQSHGLLQNTPRRYLDDMRSIQNHGRPGGGERYHSHGHNADNSGELRRASMLRNSNQRTVR